MLKPKYRSGTKIVKNDLRVKVRRCPYSGTTESIIIRESDNGYYPITLDREGGRMDKTTVIGRAKSIAKKIDCKYEEDLTWHCLALRKLPCKCPNCLDISKEEYDKEKT